MLHFYKMKFIKVKLDGVFLRTTSFTNHLPNYFAGQRSRVVNGQLHSEGGSLHLILLGC